MKVLCHGKFDVLHAGHIVHLREAKKFGDYLIVSITHEDFLDEKPIFNAQERISFLSELKLVDAVYICKDVTGVAAIEEIKPHFYVKGEEYKKIYREVGTDASWRLRIEEKAIKDLGGLLVYTSGDVFSSSSIRSSHRRHVNE